MEIISRWMVNKPQSGDVWELKKVVNLNTYLSRVWIDQLARQILGRMHGTEPCRYAVQTKGQLKDFAVGHPTYTNARIEDMRARYLRYPEDFYRETPIDGSFYVMDVGSGKQFLACTRIKLFRRIAEKGARRIVDFMLRRIRATADALAEERARQMGIPRHQLFTPPLEMVAEFEHAERRVIKSIKRGTIRAEMPVLAIPDVVGIKLIAEDTDYSHVLSVLTNMPECRILEVERHVGSYNAVNLRLAYRLPREYLLAHPPGGGHLRILEFRGFAAHDVTREYHEFVGTAEPEVQLEVIVSNFQEYLESEIGRCMHEERVLSQRRQTEYAGFLATGVRYLMDYILGLCRAGGIREISDVPFKLWVKYMPDTYEHVLRSLTLPDDMFFDTVAESVGGDDGSLWPAGK